MKKQEEQELKRVIFYRPHEGPHDTPMQVFEVQVENESNCTKSGTDFVPPSWPEASRPLKTMKEMMREGDMLRSEGFTIVYQQVTEWK